MIYRGMVLLGVVLVSLGTSLGGGVGMTMIMFGGIICGYVGGQADHYWNNL